MELFNRGDIIRNKVSGMSYVVIGRQGNELVAARIVEVSNVPEWEHVSPPLPSGMEQELEELKGDLRLLVAWVYSVPSGDSSDIEEGSEVNMIMRRWS